MLENIAQVEQVRPSVNINDILITPIRVDGKKVGTHYDMTPDSNWKDINKFDKATQVKKTDGSSDALSDHLLNNVKTIAELAHKNKYITEQDINRKDPLKDKDGKVIAGVERKPLSFLEIKNGRLIIPDVLTAQQTQELMFLIYGKVVNNVDRDPGSRKQPEVLIEDIQKAMYNFSEAGKVDKSAKLILDTQSPQTVLRALNISLRKSVENAIKESTYSITKDLEKKGESATQRLLKRLEVGAHVRDEVDGPTIKKVVEGKMDVFTNKNGESRELEQTVQYDLLMAQAFDVLIPPEARLEMEQAEIAISKEPGYMEKAKKQADLVKTRQIWRIAMLDYFNASKLIPGTEFSQYANDLNNNKIFSPEEQDLVHKFSKEIRQRKASLDRKSKNGFNDLNINSVNTLKAQELLLMLKPAGTVQIPDGLNNILSRAHEITEVVGDSPKEVKTKKDALIKSLIKDSGILNGLQEEKSELAEKILRDVIATKNSIDKRLRDMPNSDVDVKYGTLDFASSIDSGIKGIDILYRRGLSQSIDEADRYYGHDIVRDANEKTHLMRKLKKGEKRSKKNGFGEDLPPGGASSEGGSASMSQEHVESSVSTTPIKGEEKKPATENDQAAEIEKKINQNKQASEVAKILNLTLEGNKDARVELLNELLKLNQAKLVEKTDSLPKHIEINIPKVDVDSVDKLEAFSKFREVYEDHAIIQIDSLNVTIQDVGSIETTPIQNFNIDTLTLSGSTENNSETNIVLIGGSCRVIKILQGQFNILANTVPDTINMYDGNLPKACQIVLTQNSLEGVLSKKDKVKRSNFLMGENSIIQIGLQGEGERGENTVIYQDSGPHNETKNNIGEFKLINANGEYKLVEISYKYPEAETTPIASALTGTKSGKQFFKEEIETTQSKIPVEGVADRLRKQGAAAFKPDPINEDVGEDPIQLPTSTLASVQIPLRETPINKEQAKRLKKELRAMEENKKNVMEGNYEPEKGYRREAFVDVNKGETYEGELKKLKKAVKNEDPAYEVDRHSKFEDVLKKARKEAEEKASTVVKIPSAYTESEEDAQRSIDLDKKFDLGEKILRQNEIELANIKKAKEPEWAETQGDPEKVLSAVSAPSTAPVGQQPSEKTDELDIPTFLSKDAKEKRTSDALERLKNNLANASSPPTDATPVEKSSTPFSKKLPDWVSTPQQILQPESESASNSISAPSISRGAQDEEDAVKQMIMDAPENPLFPGTKLQKAMIRSGFDLKSSSLFINGLNEIISSKKFNADKLENILGSYTFDKIKEGGHEEIISTLSQYVVEKSAIEPENNNVRSVALRLLEEITKDKYYFENQAILLKSSIDLAMVYTNKPEENYKAIKFLKNTGERFGLKTEDSRFNGDELSQNFILTAFKDSKTIRPDCLDVFNSPEAQTFLMYVQNGEISTKSKDFFSKFHTRIDSLDYEIVDNGEVKLQKKASPSPTPDDNKEPTFSDDHNERIEQQLKEIAKKLPKPGTEISGRTLLGLYEDIYSINEGPQSGENYYSLKENLENLREEYSESFDGRLGHLYREIASHIFGGTKIEDIRKLTKNIEIDFTENHFFRIVSAIGDINSRKEIENNGTFSFDNLLKDYAKEWTELYPNRAGEAEKFPKTLEEFTERYEEALKESRIKILEKTETAIKYANLNFNYPQEVTFVEEEGVITPPREETALSDKANATEESLELKPKRIRKVAGK